MLTLINVQRAPFGDENPICEESVFENAGAYILSSLMYRFMSGYMATNIAAAPTARTTPMSFTL